LQNGFGHKIYGFDPGTRTDLRIAGRNNSSTWTDMMTITSTGNVGIGTTEPGSRLVVNGKTRMLSGLTIGADEDGPDFYPLFIRGQSGATAAFKVDNQPLDTKVWQITVNVNRWRVITSSDDYSAAQEAFGIYRSGINVTTVLFPNGNVGIGTTTDTKGYKLAVNGSAVFTRAVVKQYANWPDFVFEKNYDLLPLMELEQYVNRHKHLPDMPSAAEVERDGLDLGAMNRKLLQKVEELTLYLLDMKKENDQLKERVEKLEAAAGHR
jgi:hypothetical protein